MFVRSREGNTCAEPLLILSRFDTMHTYICIYIYVKIIYTVCMCIYIYCYTLYVRVCLYIYIHMYAESIYVQYLIPSPILNIPRNKPYLGSKSRDVQFYNVIQIPRKILATIQVPHSVSIIQRVPGPTMSHLRSRRGLAESSCCARHRKPAMLEKTGARCSLQLSPISK